MTHHKRAFTLIELLVVISIIAFLIAMLLPALVKAKESTRSTQCLSNIQAFAQGSTLYALDNANALPGSNARQGGLQFPAWATRILDYTQDAYNSFRCPERGEDYVWERTMRSDSDKPAWAVEFANQQTAATYGLSVDEAIPNGRAGMRFSYGYNDWGISMWGRYGRKTGAGGDMWEENSTVFIDQVKTPNHFFLLSDRGDYDDVTNNRNPWRWNIDPVNNNADDPDPNGGGNGIENPSGIHEDGSNVAFGDGHGEHVLLKDMLIDNYGNDLSRVTGNSRWAEIARHWNSNGRADPRE